jgi:hypothetical protein
MIRIPEKGGLPPEGSKLPRGLLLLRVETSEKPDPGVQVASGPAAEVRAPTPASIPSAVRRRGSRAVPIVAILVVLWIALLVFLRVTGRG